MIYQGIAGADGIAIGEAFIYRRQDIQVEQTLIEADQIEAEIDQFQAAVRKSAKQLAEVRDAALAELGEEKAAIFDAHLAFLSDEAFVGEMARLIREQCYNAGFAVDTIAEQYHSLFVSMDDEYMRERADDIKDVGARLLRNVRGLSLQGLGDLTKEAIVIAEELTPSDTMTMNRKLVKGLVVAKGGRTSHAAIIARTLEMPAVLALGESCREIANGDLLVVDGTAGIVVSRPTDEQLAVYRAKQAEYEAARTAMKELACVSAVTRDGRKVEIAGNIGTPQDVEAVIKNGGDGVGLYRTEFLYMERSQLPSEEEQFAAYRSVAEALQGKTVIIRTLDVGGDKQLPCLPLPKEENPFLGWRAIRISLERRDLFKTQLRAILRASAFGSVWVMYPMISGIQELREANAVLAEAKTELRQEGVAFDETIKAGIMIEIPSAAIMADILIKEADFFSIGTNDLCQYTLAVDRMNEKIAHLYQPLHPAILRLLKSIIEASHRHGKITGMCGELAGDPLATVILLGLGLDEFSMNASSMLEVKRIICGVSYTDARQAAEAALQMETPEEVAAFAQLLSGR